MRVLCLILEHTLKYAKIAFLIPELSNYYKDFKMSPLTPTSILLSSPQCIECHVSSPLQNQSKNAEQQDENWLEMACSGNLRKGSFIINAQSFPSRLPYIMAGKKATFQDTDLYIDAFRGSKEVLFLLSELQPLLIMRPADMGSFFSYLF